MTTALLNQSSIIHNFPSDVKSRIWAWSFAGSMLSYTSFIFILISFLCIRNLRRRLPFRMVMNLTAVDMIMTVSGTINVDAYHFDVEHHNLCVSIGFIRNFTALSSLLWTLMFALTLNEFIMKSSRSMLYCEVRNYLVCYGVPFVISVVPWLLNLYGSAGLYCWLNQDEAISTHVDLVFFYIPLVCVLIALAVCYTRMFWVLKDESLTKANQKLILQFALYPCGLLLCYFFAMLDRFYNLALRNGSVIWIIELHVFMMQSQTFVNGLIYGANKTVRTQVVKTISEMKCLQRSRESDGESSSYFSIKSTFVRLSQKEALTPQENDSMSVV